MVDFGLSFLQRRRAIKQRRACKSIKIGLATESAARSAPNKKSRELVGLPMKLLFKLRTSLSQAALTKSCTRGKSAEKKENDEKERIEPADILNTLKQRAAIQIFS